MRANKRKSLDIAITDAWQKVFDETAIDDLAALENEGWMTSQSFSARTGLGQSGAACALKRLVATKRMESKKIRCHYAEKIRPMVVYRPLI